MEKFCLALSCLGEIFLVRMIEVKEKLTYDKSVEIECWIGIRADKESCFCSSSSLSWVLGHCHFETMCIGILPSKWEEYHHTMSIYGCGSTNLSFILAVGNVFIPCSTSGDLSKLFSISFWTRKTESDEFNLIKSWIAFS